MAVAMSDLVEFLTARLDEDAAGEQAWVDVCDSNFNIEKVPGNVVPPSPRMLAEVEAKRLILEVHEKIRAAYPDTTIESDPCCSNCSAGGEYPGEGWPCNTLRLIALPYADHPNYRQEWRP